MTVRAFTSTPLGAHDRGVEFGERHRTEIAATVQAYAALFSRCARATWIAGASAPGKR